MSINLYIGGVVMISDVCRFIQDNLDKGISLDILSRHFGYSKFHLSRKFKKETGYSYKQYIEALKIQDSIRNMICENTTVKDTFLNSKHESSGTFSNTFKKLTGMSPQLYKKSILKLHKFMISSIKVKKEIVYRRNITLYGGTVAVKLIYPDIHDERVSFIGLFPNGIPNSPPVVGKAVYKNTHCILDRIPEGNYHLLVTEIDLTSDISNYFLLNNNYRAKLDHPINITNDTKQYYELPMRSAIAEDPPIIVNLPLLVKKAIIKNSNY